MKKKILSIILAALMVLPVITACQSKKEDENTKNPKENIVINEEYKIIRADLADAQTVKAASLLYNTIKEKTGIDLKIGTDYVKRGEKIQKAKEILVGPTNREISFDRATLKSGEYFVGIEGDYIIIDGYDGEALYNAVKSVCTKWLTSELGIKKEGELIMNSEICSQLNGLYNLTYQQLMALEGKITDLVTLKQAKSLAWNEYIENISKETNGDVKRSKELIANTVTNIKIDSVTMKVMTTVKGKAPEGGYPMFLVYHGGGYDPDQNTNEGQWEVMFNRYSTQPGIYCAIRSVSDFEGSGQIFSTDISWKFYDRIIENGIAFLNVDPNKVYIVGYSAGGNGVYQIAPRITDRLASATMTAGHPEGISLVNLYNLPFYLQVGELDAAYNRDTITVEYAQKLDDLAKRYGGGYPHTCFVHYNTVHGKVGDNKADQTVIADNYAWLASKRGGGAYTGGTVVANTNAITLMTDHTRTLPERVVWELSVTANSNKQREINSFYWLSTEIKSGVIDATYDKSTNTITIKTDKVGKGEITVYINEEMVDIFKPVNIVLPNGTTKTITPEISIDTLRKTTAERGDPNYQFVTSFTFEN